MRLCTRRWHVLAAHTFCFENMTGRVCCALVYAVCGCLRVGVALGQGREQKAQDAQLDAPCQSELGGLVLMLHPAVDQLPHLVAAIDAVKFSF